MQINLTLILQMLVFAAFVWFTMRFVWPPLAKAMEERQNKIADGLSAAERGRRELELAQHRIKDEMKQAKSHAADIIEKANRHAAHLVDKAKEEARVESQKLAKLAQEQIAQEVNRAKDGLRTQLASLAVAGAEKILKREINETSNSALLDNLIEEI